MVGLTSGFKPNYFFYSSEKLKILSDNLSKKLRRVPKADYANEALVDFERSDFLAEVVPASVSKKKKIIPTKGRDTKDIQAALKRMSGGDSQIEQVLVAGGGQKLQGRISTALKEQYFFQGKKIEPLCIVPSALFCKEKNYLNYYSIQLIYVLCDDPKAVEPNYFKADSETGKLIKITEFEFRAIDKKIKEIRREVVQIDLANTGGHDVLSNTLLIQQKLEKELGKPIVMGGEQILIGKKDSILTASIKDMVLVSNNEEVKLDSALVASQKAVTGKEREQQLTKIKNAEYLVEYSARLRELEQKRTKILHPTAHTAQNSSEHQANDAKWEFIKIIEKFFNKILKRLFHSEASNKPITATTVVCHPSPLLARPQGSINNSDPEKNKFKPTATKNINKKLLVVS